MVEQLLSEQAALLGWEMPEGRASPFDAIFMVGDNPQGAVPLPLPPAVSDMTTGMAIEAASAHRWAFHMVGLHIHVGGVGPPSSQTSSPPPIPNRLEPDCHCRLQWMVMAVDVRGATAAAAAPAGHPWVSILVRTGVFQDTAPNCRIDPAQIVVDHVGDAVAAGAHHMRSLTWHSMR
mmetsp:Transcript_46327/g.118272  ORF Transcript_46327/g.118272 Transcript_46327/m.118272 type:complete len:177 (+) Transcript_46327:1199-1729(+)